jgi:uncharacterized RDD family membrane protein YckC
MESPQPMPQVSATGLPPGVEVGGLGRRFVAQLIDQLVAAIVGAATFGAAPFIAQRFGDLAGLIVQIVGGVLVLAWGIFVAWRFAVKAAGPGMALMGLQLVGFYDGRPIGLGRFLLRALVLYALKATGIGLLIMIVLLIMHPRKQGWHDLLVHSVVINKRPLAPKKPKQIPDARRQSDAGMAPQGQYPQPVQSGPGQYPQSGQSAPGYAATPPYQPAGQQSGPQPLTPPPGVQPGYGQAPGGGYGGPEQQRGAGYPGPGQQQPGGGYAGPGQQQPGGGYAGPGQQQPVGAGAGGQQQYPPAGGYPPAPSGYPGNPYGSQGQPGQYPAGGYGGGGYGAPPAGAGGYPPGATSAAAAAAGTGAPPVAVPPGAVPPGAVGSGPVPSGAPGSAAPPGSAASAGSAAPPASGASPLGAQQAPDGRYAASSAADGEGSAETQLAAPPGQQGGAAAAPPQTGWLAVLDDGRELLVTGLILLGRNPQPQPGEEDAQLIKIADETRTVSKSHLAIAVDSGGVFVIDRGSTNGSTVTTSSGVSTRCAAGKMVRVAEGSIVSIGDHWLEIRRATS